VRHIIFLALVVMAAGMASGCMKTKIGPNLDAGGNVFDSSYKGRQTTDLSTCQNGFPASSPIGQWVMSFDQDGVTVNAHYDIRSTGTTVTNTCSFENTKASAQVSVVSAIFPNRHEIDFKESQSETASGESGLKCSVAVNSEVLFFEFENACLRIRNASHSTFYTLVPAN
jgi:hypothetical protein